MPDSPGSQTGTLKGNLHTGVDKGFSLGNQLLISKNGEYIDVPVNHHGNDYSWEIPDVKSGDRIQIWQQVTFYSVSYSESMVTYQNTVVPQQYPPSNKINVNPDNKWAIYNGDPVTGHGGHGWNAKNPLPEKDVFPESWNADKIAAAAIAIAKNPKPYPKQPQRGSDNYLINGYYDGLNINVVVAPNGDIVTAWPDPGQPGVGRRGPDGVTR
ncbi:EndoU domain-containing protein [Nocardia acidivorans]|uniref:EndoU domain-containing protein n=1 Tax=Nocardia acidivorans TaxID=404580 RepID=UPI0012F8909F|nr:EndoU domain-containing protein [Nocardia acidivorans]